MNELEEILDALFFTFGMVVVCYFVIKYDEKMNKIIKKLDEK